MGSGVSKGLFGLINPSNAANNNEAPAPIEDFSNQTTIESRRNSIDSVSGRVRTSRSNSVSSVTGTNIVKPHNLAVTCRQGHPFIDYRFLKKIGEGAFSTVYKGVSVDDANVNVAIKEIQTSSLTKQQAYDLQLEMNILSQLKHPSIVRLQRVYCLPEKIFLIMDYLQGGELLDNICKLKQYMESDVRRIMSEIASAVEYIHSRQVIHRDIKPDNLILETKNFYSRVKLVDFGLSTVVLNMNTCNGSTTPNGAASTGESNTGAVGANTLAINTVSPRGSAEGSALSPGVPVLGNTNNNNTGTGSQSPYPNNSTSSNSGKTSNLSLGLGLGLSLGQSAVSNIYTGNARHVCGTPGYMAPEVLTHSEYGAATDMWSLGCVLFILLSGRTPFDSSSGNKDVLSGRYTMVGGGWASVSDAARQVVVRLLDINYKTRMSAAELLASPWINSNGSSKSNYAVINKSNDSGDINVYTATRESGEGDGDIACESGIKYATSDNNDNDLTESLDGLRELNMVRQLKDSIVMLRSSGNYQGGNSSATAGNNSNSSSTSNNNNSSRGRATLARANSTNNTNVDKNTNNNTNSNNSNNVTSNTTPGGGVRRERRNTDHRVNIRPLTDRLYNSHFASNISPNNSGKSLGANTSPNNSNRMSADTNDGEVLSPSAMVHGGSSGKSATLALQPPMESEGEDDHEINSDDNKDSTKEPSLIRNRAISLIQGNNTTTTPNNNRLSLILTPSSTAGYNGYNSYGQRKNTSFAKRQRARSEILSLSTQQQVVMGSLASIRYREEDEDCHDEGDKEEEEGDEVEKLGEEKERGQQLIAGH